jgi:hypothetical protein
VRVALALDGPDRGKLLPVPPGSGGRIVLPLSGQSGILTYTLVRYGMNLGSQGIVVYLLTSRNDAEPDPEDVFRLMLSPDAQLATDRYP